MSPVSSSVTVDGPTWDGPAPSLGRSLLVVAPHPDDEVLGCAGLLRWAAGRGVPVDLLAVTDGEASHRRSSRISAAELTRVRATERAAALGLLGVGAAVTVHRLGLPDGRVADHEDELTVAIASRAAPDGTILAPWAEDGHPDHDATGRAAARAAGARGAALWSVAIWAKVHRPDALGAARRLDLDPGTRAAKTRAVAAFRSQLAALGPSPLDGPVVHPGELAAMLAGPEVVFVP